MAFPPTGSLDGFRRENKWISLLEIGSSAIMSLMKILIPHIGHTVFIQEKDDFAGEMENATMRTDYKFGERETTVVIRDRKNINLPCLVHEFVHVSQLIFEEYAIPSTEKEHQAYLVQFLLNEWIIKNNLYPILKL